ENEIVEFKEAKNSYDFLKLGKYFSALSNEANLCDKPFGWLVFGIKDKDKVEIRSRRGYAILPAVVTTRVLQGGCFAPFHWNDIYGDDLAINAVTSDKVDAISQQPELKVCAVKLTRVNIIAADSEIQNSQQGVGFKPALTAVQRDTSTQLITAFAQSIGLAEAPPPQFTDEERKYLNGYISGLRASATYINTLPGIPADAPLNPQNRTWINGLLAGMFSSVLPFHLVEANRLDTNLFETQAQAQPKITVLWASQTGNAESLAEKFGSELTNAGWVVNLKSMDDYNPAGLTKERHLFLISSTFGDGDAPDNGQVFWSQLRAENFPNLNQLQFAVLAIGDSNYGQFCGHGKNLFSRLQALGAQPLIDRLDCDTDFDEIANQWFNKLNQQLKLTVQVNTSSSADKKVVTLLWASQTGNAEELALKVSTQLTTAGWSVNLQPMDEYTVDALAKDSCALFITSTFGDGDAPDNGGGFWHQLNNENVPALENLEFALLALGDSNYDLFFASADNHAFRSLVLLAGLLTFSELAIP
ncbi:MAG: hypothetical protein EOO68_17660, partial [Moraxellaceae bacterium]